MRAALLASLLLVALVAPLGAGEVVDGIAASVNGRAILLSDVQAEVAYQCLLAAPSPCVQDEAASSAARTRLIERELVTEEMKSSGFAASGEEQIGAQINQLRQKLLGAQNSELHWQQLLERYGLEPADIRERVRAQAQELSFINARFRPLVRVEQTAIEQYYRQQLLPQLPPGSAAPALSAVEGQIREVLTQQAITAEFNSWLATLRQQSEIEVH